MSTYTDVAGFLEAASQEVLDLLSDDDGSGAYDVAVAQRALDESESLVDSYISAYLPLTAPYHESIKGAVYAIAAHKLAAPRGVEREDGQKHYDETIAWLRDLAKGIATLPLPDDASASLTPAAPLVEVQDVVFSRSKMGAF